MRKPKKELIGKYFPIYQNEDLFNAVQGKLFELGAEWNMNGVKRMTFSVIDECIQIGQEHRTMLRGSIESAKSTYRCKEMPLDELFALKPAQVETIEIGGRKYSKEEVEDRLKDLEELK